MSPKQSSINILDLRLSFIWVETILDLLDPGKAFKGDLACLRIPSSYLQFWQKLWGGAGPRPRGPVSVEPPWTECGDQHFWRYYVRQQPLTPLEAKEAKNAVVPVRCRLPAAASLPLGVSAPWLPGEVMAEGLFYPYGVAFMLTAKCLGNFTLKATEQLALDVRRNNLYAVQQGNAPLQQMPLDHVADLALTALRQVGFDPAAAQGSRVARPYRVVTVVHADAEDFDSSVSLPDGGDVHRALEVWTETPSTYPKNKLPPLRSCQAPLKSHTAPPGHVLYQRDRGIAVWYPMRFLDPVPKEHHRLACYHRNLAFCLLQIESLQGLIKETAALYPQALKQDHLQWAKRAAIMLSLLYGEHEQTYQLPCARTHMKLNGYLDNINKVRDMTGLPPNPLK